MTQEQRDLLVNDLSMRLPYGVKVQYENEIFDVEYVCPMYDEIKLDNHENWTLDIEEVKPYLFPLSSMSDELWDKEFRGYCITEFTRDSFKYGCETLEFYNGNPVLSGIIGFINSLIKNHFDIYGLIPMGLATNATGKNIY